MAVGVGVLVGVCVGVTVFVGVTVGVGVGVGDTLTGVKCSVIFQGIWDAPHTDNIDTSSTNVKP